MKGPLKIFLATGIAFGTFIGVFFGFQNGAYVGLASGLIAGVLFGGAMAFILGSFPGRQVQRAGNVYHERILEIKTSLDKAQNLCVESLKLIKGSKIRKQDSSQGIIIAKTGLNWKTWGDVITFELRKISRNDHIQIKVSSKPVLPTTLVDYGKNRENVDTISSFLESTNKK